MPTEVFLQAKRQIGDKHLLAHASYCAFVRIRLRRSHPSLERRTPCDPAKPLFSAFAKDPPSSIRRPKHSAAAERWAKGREMALESPGAWIRATAEEQSLSQLIRWYIDQFAKMSQWQRTKQSQLFERFLMTRPEVMECRSMSG
jgi:hypothetical protein